MRKIFLAITFFIIANSCKAQIFPLRTYTQIPQQGYLKDTNNELQDYVGTWYGSWNNKTILISITKKINQYDSVLKYYKDFLIGKFKVTDSNGNILFDNTNLSDDNAKITGGKFRKVDNKYSLIYLDPDVCFMTGSIRIYFVDSTKMQLNWQFSDMTDIITPDCPYYNANPFPQPLPANIVLTKQ